MTLPALPADNANWKAWAQALDAEARTIADKVDTATLAADTAEHVSDGSALDVALRAASVAAGKDVFGVPLGNAVAIIDDSTGVGGNSPVIPDIDFGDGTRAPTSTANVGTIQRGESPLSYATLLSGGRIHYAVNASVAGDLSTQYSARFAADVVAKAPAVAVFGSAINDIGQSTAGTAAAAFDAYKASIKAMVAQCRAARIVPVVHTTLPNNNALSGQDRKGLIAKYNAWLNRYALAERLTIIDYHAAMVDPSTGGYNASLVGADGTHPSAAGYLILGQLLANTLGALLPSRKVTLPDYNADPNNLATNGLFITDSNADGLADSFFQFNQPIGATYAVSLITDSAVLGKMQRLTMSGATPSQYGVTTTALTVASGKFAVGDRCLVSGIVTNSGLASVNVQVTFAGSTATTTKFTPVSISQNITRGVFSAEFIVPPGTTSVSVALFNRGGTGYCEIGQMGLYNLTKLGLETV